MKNGLIEVKQGEDRMWIHPTTLEAHKNAGWELVDPQDQVEAAKAGLMVVAPKELKGKLVKVWKDGETLEVNQTTLEAHIQAGWKIVDPDYLKQNVETAEAKMPKAEKAVPARRPPQKRG